MDNIIEILNKNLNNSFFIFTKLEKKNTIRSLQKYILVDKNNKQYLFEIATNSIEIFYFKRTIEYQENLNKLKHNFKLNLPLYIKIGNKLSYALYEYFDDISFFTNSKPVEELIEFYKNNSIEMEITDENIEKILINFLSAWPNQYHAMIRRQKEFQDYKQELEKYQNIQVCYEHGDFTTNNIFNILDKLYLMDFEFAREYQPIGFDKYDYNKSIQNNSSDETLHGKKYLLIEKINQKIDNNDINIEIYDSLNNNLLKENWNNLYQDGANYNLSYIWCQTWLKYFKKKNYNIFIFTIWDNNNLVFLAPLYICRNILYLIGSNPDLFDSFDLLYTNEKYIKQFYDFVFTNNYNIDFRYLDADSVIAKNLIKYLYQNKIVYDSQIVDTKPRISFDTFKIKTKENSDIKRCKNRAIKKFNEELNFEIKIDKNENVLDEFISIHKERWGGGPFENIKKYDLFIKEISQTDLVVISKLSIKSNTVAYHFAYKDSNNILNSAIPSYSNKYNDISPGKILLYEVLDYSKNNDDKYFDFGRGAEEYKYWFSNESSILFHIKTHSNKNIIIKAKKFINRILNKLNRILYA